MEVVHKQSIYEMIEKTIEDSFYNKRGIAKIVLNACEWDEYLRDIGSIVYGSIRIVVSDNRVSSSYNGVEIALEKRG